MPGATAPATPTTCASSGSRSRIGARFGSDCGSTKATRACESASRNSSASAPNRNDSGTAIAPIRYAAMWATTVSGRCGRMIAMRSPRRTPRAASALASRSAARSRSQNVNAARAPDSSSQYSAKRARSRAHRRQQASAMLNSAGTSQRCAAWASAWRSLRMAGPARSQPRGAAFAGCPGGGSSSGSTVAHTQSGSCSISRPKRIASDAFVVWTRKRRVGWYSLAGTISDCTA